MNVASLELCKELFELSGWEDTEKVWYQVPEDDDSISYEVLNYGEVAIRDGVRVGSDLAPAYDLGYLMRKLGDNVELEHFGAGWDVQKYHEDSFTSAAADTSEDAAAKLAIELIKQNVLDPKEDNHGE